MSHLIWLEALPHRPADKDCALLCICVAIEECCHQKEIDVAYEDIHSKLYDRYGDRWRRLERNAFEVPRSGDMNGDMTGYERESIGGIQRSSTIQIPGRDIEYNMSYFMDARFRLIGRTKEKKHYEIKIRIDLLRGEDDGVRVLRTLDSAKDKDAVIIQTISDDANHCRNVIFKCNGPIGNTTEKNAPHIIFHCFDKQKQLGPKEKRYPEINTRTMKHEKTKWNILIVSMEDETPGRDEDKETYFDKFSDN